MLTKLKNCSLIQNFSPERFFIRLFSSWCTTSIVFMFIVEKQFTEILDYNNRFSLLSFIIAFVAIFTVYSAIAALSLKIQKKFDDWCLPISFGAYCVYTAMQSNERWYFAFVLIAFAGIMIYYYAQKNKLVLKKPLPAKKTVVLVSAFAVLFIITVGGIGVIRYTTFSTPNYDFGIFCNMYYNMKESFRPITTCERDELLSHFSVHLSPIYYLLLPVFMIFPSGATLQISQAVILASAVVPICLIAKKYGLSNIKTVLIAAVCLFHPATAAGTNYDFHENCFLLPLLLWVFLFFEKEKYIPMAIFTLLTLCVKEDAAIYIIFFAIYVILSRKKYFVGFVLALGAAIWFFGALAYLSSSGEGIMSGRYSNFITSDGSLIDAVKNVLVNPAYAFSQIFINEKGEYGDKILFMLQMFIPLAFLPFAVKKITNLLLLLPMLVINLITVYPYQYDIGFQYSFGVLAFLLYLSVINLAELNQKNAKITLSIAVAGACLMFMMSPAIRFLKYSTQMVEKKESYTVMEQALDEIPQGSSVICSTFLLPHLANRSEIYEVHYHEPREGETVDYVILDTRFEYDMFLEQYEELGYKITKTVSYNDSDLMLILEP